MMVESIPFLISGILFGLVAGIFPGPLLTLVISETVKHNRKEGMIVACAPILTDLPIVLLSIFVLSKLANFNLILGILSILGASFIIYLAYESITMKGIELNLQKIKAQSLRRGVITNFLSPNPYLFWITVGAPTVLKGYKISLLSSLLFILGFYLFLVGSKIMVVLLVDKSKSFLKSNTYVYIIRALGLMLFIFSAIYIKDGLKYFGII
jgi:threonine/homoserine/homoserine lactone efflux protein